MDDDEDSRLFVSMLDAAAERVFQTCSEMMAAESSAIPVTWDDQINQQNSSLLQGKELSLEWSPNPISTTSPPSVEVENSCNGSRKRSKRCRSPDQLDLQQHFSTRNSYFQTNERTWPSLSSADYFSVQGFGVNKPVKELETRKASSSVKKLKKPRRKSAFGTQRNLSNADSVGFSVNSEVPVARLSPTAGNEVPSESEDVEKFDDFSKEIHEALARIESLIPSLQKLVSSDQTPADQKAVDFSDPQNISSFTPDASLADLSGFKEITLNEQDHPAKFDMPSKGKISTPFAPDQNTASSVRDTKPLRKYTGTNETVKQVKADISINWLSAPSDGRVKSNRLVNDSLISSVPGESDLDRNFRVERSPVGQNRQLPMDRIESSRRSLSRNKSDYEQYQSHARGKFIQFTDSTRKNSFSRKHNYRGVQSKSIALNQISDDSSWSSPVSSSQSSTQQSDYPSSLSKTYPSSGSYNSEGGYEIVRHSPRRKWSGARDSMTGYETSSYYSSQDQYSDSGPSSRMSSVRHQKQENHLQKYRRQGRFSKLRNKIGMIFHHHHHHHHHYSERDEPDVHHAGFWKRLGKPFHRTGRNRQRLKDERSQKPVNKIMVKKRQHGGHFSTLVGGLIRHMKRPKKSKHDMDDIGRLGGARHRGKKAKTKVPWWPKKYGRRNGVKITSKGRVKFRTKTGRHKLAAAKMILS